MAQEPCGGNETGSVTFSKHTPLERGTWIVFGRVFPPVDSAFKKGQTITKPPAVLLKEKLIISTFQLDWNIILNQAES